MSTTSKKVVVKDAHSKLILAGEHAVVYGKPAISIPFPLKVRVKVEEAYGPIMFYSSIYTGPIYNMPSKLKGILNCIKETLDYLKKPSKGLHIQVDSAIPLGRGLGSSAAIATAIVRSLFSFYGQSPTRDKLFELVNIAETYAHGNPSGIDMASIANDNPILFKREKEAIPIKYGKPLYIVVGDTGRIGDTRRAVENVKNRYVLDPEKVKETLYEIEKIVDEAKLAITHGDRYLLGKLLSCNHEKLINLGVSDHGLNQLVEVALNGGALGAKLTGGGLGGCIIALANNLEHSKIIADELMKWGASNSWYFSTSENTLYTAISKRGIN